MAKVKKLDKKAANVAHYDTILAPLVTEKSTIASEQNKYSFKVNLTANKTTVKDAIQSLFGVEVTKVNVIVVEGKSRVFRGRKGKRSDFKKAIVTLKEGQSIDLTSGLKN